MTYNSKESERVLNDGYVLAIPTETVYGFAIKYDDEIAYERLCAVKGRRMDKPIAVMMGKNKNLDDYFYLSKDAKKIIDAFLPGPLTCLLKARDNMPYQTHLGSHVVGLRIPKKEELLNFLETLPYPLQVTSANYSSHPALTEFIDVYNSFKDVDDVKGIIKGECNSKTPTTVVDLTSDEIKIIREGEINYKMLKEVIDR